MQARQAKGAIVIGMGQGSAIGKTRRLGAGSSLLIAAAVGLAAMAPLHTRASGDAIVLWLADRLENRFTPAGLADQRPVRGIVVLGGGDARFHEARLLALAHPRARIILSGPGAEEAAIVATDPAISGRVSIDRRARNTYENARFSRQLADPKPGERWVVVTSGLHLPRSIGAFRAAGFDVEPWPVRTPARRHSDIAVSVRHEVLALITYRMLGRTQALFPGPGA